MTPEEAIIARLQDIAAVTALVDDRIYMLVLRQDAVLPAIRVQLIDDLLDYHLKGGTPVGPARVQVDCWAHASDGADPYANAIAVAAAIHGDDAGSGLSGWIGTLGSPPFSVRGIFRIDRDVTWDADERRDVRVRQDYHIHFRA